LPIAMFPVAAPLFFVFARHRHPEPTKEAKDLFAVKRSGLKKNIAIFVLNL
jgi:hypothetical protein